MTDLERSARLLAKHLKLALPYARELFQSQAENAPEWRSRAREMVGRDGADYAGLAFWLDAMCSERIYRDVIARNGPSVLTKANPYD